MRAVSCLVLVAVAAIASPARADDGTLDDSLGPREIAVGEALRGGATGATAIALNPAGLPLNREMVFEGGYGYRGSDDASLINVSLCDSTSGMPGCLFYNYAGTNPSIDGMDEHTSTNLAGLALARALLPRVYVGAVARYFNVSSNATGMSTSGFNFDFGLDLRLTEAISAGFSGQNMVGTDAPDELPRALGGGLLVRPIPSISLGFDARWRLEGAQQGVRYGGGAEWFIKTSNGQTGVPIRFGGLRDDGMKETYLSAGLGLAMMKWDVDVGARYAVEGLKDTQILASLRIFGPRLPSPASE
jgi:hypothetical protein